VCLNLSRKPPDSTAKKAPNIGTGIHYPIPLHLQTAYRGLGYREGDFPVTKRIAAEILSLPMYPQLGRAEQEYVVESVLEYLCLDSARAVSSGGARVESVA
jgi:dTDP-4-amino-4,6-dideoxygalactose transaminase